MARQKGIIKLKGSIGDITFYKTQDGYLAREKGGVDGHRIATDPSFQRTRENGAEFGRAGKAGKLLRSSIRSLLFNASDSRVVGRLTKTMVKILQADTVSERGLRNVVLGDLGLLVGFEFNIRGKLGTTLFAPYTVTINRVDTVLEVKIVSFVPVNMISAPRGTTHFKIVSGAMAIDFEEEFFDMVSAESDVLEWNAVAVPDLTLSNQFTEDNGYPLLFVLGIEFFQEVNGKLYSLKNGLFNPLSVVAVDIVK